jgi:RimJ/RimL family protein N-acetyltransferase
LNIRRLTPSDADAYRSLLLPAYALYPYAFTSSAAERAALPFEWWVARLTDSPKNNEIVFGAFVDDALVGTVTVERMTRERTRHLASLIGMYVADSHQKKGIGHALISAALEWAASQGVQVMQLTVSGENESAERLYTRLGFVQFGVLPLAVRYEDRYAAKVYMYREIQ